MNISPPFLFISTIVLVLPITLVLGAAVEEEYILKTINGSSESSNEREENYGGLGSLFGKSSSSLISIVIILFITFGIMKRREIKNNLLNLFKTNEINKDSPRKRLYKEQTLSSDGNITVDDNSNNNNSNIYNNINNNINNIINNNDGINSVGGTNTNESTTTIKRINLENVDNDTIFPSKTLRPILTQSKIIHQDYKKVMKKPLDLVQGKKVSSLPDLSQQLKDCDTIKNKDIKFYKPQAEVHIASTSGRYGLDLEDEESEPEILPSKILETRFVKTQITPSESTHEKFIEIYNDKMNEKKYSRALQPPTQPKQAAPKLSQEAIKALQDVQIKKTQSKQAIETQLNSILELVEQENEEIRKAEELRLAKLRAEKERIERERMEKEKEQERIRLEQERKIQEQLQAEEEKRKAQSQQPNAVEGEIDVSPIKSTTGTHATQPSTSENKDISIVNPYTGPKKTLSVPPNTRPKSFVIAKIYIDRMEEMYASFQKRTDPTLKPEMDASKKLINKTINRITDSNQREIVREISQIMNKQKGKKDIFNFCLYFYAKTIMDQAASQSGDLKKLLPFIQVTSDLMNDSPEILDAVIGYIHTNCIFTIPYFPNEKEVTNAADFKKKLGFKEEDGEVESQAMFMGRMTDMITIYGMIIQNNPPGHKYGIEKGWEWMASFLNTRPNIFTIEILDAFIGIAGYKLHTTYKAQFGKLLEFIQDHILSNPPKGSDKASISRFSDLITNYKKTKQIPRPSFLD